MDWKKYIIKNFALYSQGNETENDKNWLGMACQTHEGNEK
jgi:hypothetical protein